MELINLLKTLAEDNSNLLMIICLTIISFGTLKSSLVPSQKSSYKRYKREDTAYIRWQADRHEQSNDLMCDSNDLHVRDFARGVSFDPKWKKWKAEYNYNLQTREYDPIPENIEENKRNKIH